MDSWRLGRAWSFALLAVVSLLLVSADARAGCKTDMQCKGDRICRDGECVDPGGPQSCEADVDCPGNQICAGGICKDPAGGSESDQEERTAEAAPVAEPGGDEEERFPTQAIEEHRNTKAMIAGAVLTPAGFVSVLIGTLWAAAKPDRVGSHPAPYSVFWIAGGTAMLTGIALLIYGAPTVEIQGEASAQQITVEPLVGPTGGGLRVRF